MQIPSVPIAPCQLLCLICWKRMCSVYQGDCIVLDCNCQNWPSKVGWRVSDQAGDKSYICRDREFQLWNAKLAAKQGGGDDKGLAKQGTTHAIMAWCHQPALRVRFSAGQLEALAGSRELR